MSIKDFATKNIADWVKCNNCNIDNMAIDPGIEQCPICKADGCLAWMDEEQTEIELD